MNVGEERNRQKLSEVLELLKLTDKNQILAEQYLDTEREEERELLTGAEPQDFSGLDDGVRKKSREYMSHCLKRNRREEFGRFVRFGAAVGGSTAYYILVSYGWSLNLIREYLSREQAAAIRSEGIAWNPYGIRNILSNMEQKSPDVLRGAMKLCYHKSDNAKVLLAALSLHYTEPLKPAGGIIEKLLSGRKTGQETQTEVQETVEFLETNLTDSISNLFTGAVPSEEMLDKMKHFVRHSSVTDPFPAELYAAIRKLQTSEYLLMMLAGAAFLAFEHSEQCAAFVRLAIAMDHQQKRTSVLQMCMDVGKPS